MDGEPTTVHSPLRQAIALGFRLGCPLQQIFYTLLANSMSGRHDSNIHRPALHIYSLSKARTVLLARAVHAFSPLAVSGAGEVAGIQIAYVESV
jgi:hypothetical protein